MARYTPAHLDFGALRTANALRCEDAFHPITEWSETDWGCALAGEAGELCNLLKKRRRGESVPLKAVMDEIADVIVYADLLAARLGAQLSSAVRSKFNEVSDRVGSKVKL